MQHITSGKFYQKTVLCKFGANDYIVGCVEKHFFSLDQFETRGELSLGVDY